MSSSSEIIDLGNEPDYRKTLSKFYWSELFISSFCEDISQAIKEDPSFEEQFNSWTEADFRAAYEDPGKRQEMLFGHK